MFRFFGSLFGKVIWFFLEISGNYVVSIFLFTLLVDLLLLPFTIKRMKAAPQQAKFAEKQRELRKFCGRDTKKYNEELLKMCETEGYNPMNGSFSMLLPLLFLLCVFFAVSKPLEYIAQIPPQTLSQAEKIVQDAAPPNVQKKERYVELALLRNFDEFRPQFTMFSEEEISKVEKIRSAFNLCGMRLIDVPKFSPFSAFLWILPVFSFLFSLVSGCVMQKINGMDAQMGIFMKAICYILNPLFFAWTTYISPAALGVYWVINSMLNVLQNVILSKIYNKYSLSAREEFIRFRNLEAQERKMLGEA